MASKQFSLFNSVVRKMSTKPSTNVEIQPVVTNRNPRNLELLRLQKKPSGYGVDNRFVEFWNKLVYISRPKYIAAQIIHSSNKVIVEASTKEWALQKYLYSCKDKQAHIVLGKVFAERCIESGIYNCACDFQPDDSETNLTEFLKVLKEEGLSLEEPEYYDIYDVWRKPREKRPWTVLEE